jgi:DNA polymerase-3 subunit beta
MKLSCEKYVLQNAVSVALRAAASKSPITALEGLLLEASVDLKITGYDLKEGIYTLMAADVEEPGSIVVSAKLFSEMIRRMPDGIVTISTDENLNINVRCGKSDFHFMGISAEEYPEMPDVNGQSHVTLPQKILRSMITQTIFAVATSDARPIYTGTLFEINGSELTLVSVDGYRLAKRTEHIENGQMENGSFVVPGSALSDVERICGDDEEATVQIAVGLKHISFGIGDTVVITRRLEGDFLNYRKSIPENFRYQIKINRGDFMATIDRCALIVSEKNTSPIRMTFGEDRIDCRCVTPVGRAEDVCPCQGSGDGMEIGFNDRYMMDALKAANTDELVLRLNTSSSPSVLEAADGSKSFTYMILPVRLRAGE